MSDATEADAPSEPQEEKGGFQFPSTMTVLILVTLLVWIAAFLIPSGTYQLDEKRRSGARVVRADRLGPRSPPPRI